MRKTIINWLKEQVKRSAAKGIILGLSGGIDSSVVACLAKEAVGVKNVFGLFMPCHSHPRDLKDARILAAKLKIRTKVVDLSGVYDSFIKVLPKGKSLAQANLRPRLRMATLYYFANNLNYLVCGTGNKSELMAGYFTKYGDGGVDLLPIAELTKTQVRKLAAELNIPAQIISKPPTAGLWPGQTDEGEMGITYPELDDIITRFECRKTQVHSKKKVDKVKSMIERSEHKRLGPKVCKI